MTRSESGALYRALRPGSMLLLGAVTVAGFAPAGLFPLPWITLALLVASWDRAPGRRSAMLLGYAFGLGYFLAGVSWVFVSMHQFGGMPAPLAAIATALFCAYLALFPALAGGIYAALRRGRAWCDVPLAAAAWGLSEWLRGWLLSGFPWLALGYAHTPPSPIAGYAPVLGVYGMSFVSMLIAASFAAAWNDGRRVAWAAAAAAVGGSALLGAGLARVQWTSPAGAPITVSLLQGNIEQSLKWRPERFRDSLEVYLDLARRNPARLVILPETAIPAALDQLPEGFLDALREAAGAGNAVLLGAVVREGGRHFNSAIGAQGARIQRYDKSHLVPFGEFTPRYFAWTLRVLRIPMSDFSPGAAAQTPMSLAGERIAANICYEDVFGERIARALPEATLHVNLSNTAWFGDSLAQPQHLQIARVRALETGRYMLRATNTGMTAVVDPAGTVAAAIPAFTRGALRATVRGFAGSTPYARWGNAAFLSLSGIALMLAIGARARAGAAGPGIAEYK